MAETKSGTMKAARIHEGGLLLGKPVSIDDLPIPQPVGREILIRVKAASLCHSDISIISGLLGSDAFFPQVIGHEAVGIVEMLGTDAGAFGFEVGDFVGAPLWHNMCLECNECRNIGPQFCQKGQIKGLTSPGCFSEYTCIDAASAIVIAKSRAENTAQMPARNFSPLFCAGVTIWDALEQASLKPGETLAIAGVGGLGQLAVQFASALGANVIALDVRDEQLKACKGKEGASEIVNTSNLDPQALIKSVADVNNGVLVDAVVVTSGAIAAYRTALSIVRPNGRVIAVGVPKEDVPVDMGSIALRNVSVIGAHVPGQISTRKCIDFAIRKNIIPRVHERKFKLEDLNEMIDLMKAGKVDEGRMVVEFF